MTIDAYVDKLGRDLVAFESDVLRIVEAGAVSSISEVRNRVTSSGSKADGDRFSPYSQRWAKERRKKGLQVDHKDFLFTGDMWKSVKKISSSKDPISVSVTMGATGNENREKMDVNTEREGMGILVLSPKEEENFKRDVERKIIALFA